MQRTVTSTATATPADGHAGLVPALAGALVRNIDMARDDAYEIAAFVAAAFAGRDEVDDGELPPDLRSIFYTLEGQRLLTFRREEYTNEEGEMRRAFFWALRWENIRAEAPPEEPVPKAEKVTVYDELPQQAWTRAVS